MRQGITVHFILVYVMPREAHQAAARDLNDALEAGRYRPHVARVFGLDATAAAHGGAGKRRHGRQAAGKDLSNGQVPRRREQAGLLREEDASGSSRASTAACAKAWRRAAS